MSLYLASTNPDKVKRIVAETTRNSQNLVCVEEFRNVTILKIDGLSEEGFVLKAVLAQTSPEFSVFEIL